MASTTLQANREERRRMMLEAPVAKVIPVVAIPSIISMLVDSIYNLADTFFVSQIGTYATAAVGVNDSLMMLLRAVAMGFGVGASSYISRLLGAKREDEANQVAATALYTTVAVGVLMCIIGFVFMQPLVMLLGSTENTRAYTMDYARFILLAAPVTSANVVLQQLLRAEGSTSYSMFGMVSGCVVNIVLDPLFINVFHWGVAGAAAATALSKCISLVVLLIPFLRKRTVLEIAPRLFRPRVATYLEIGRMGIPTLLRSSLMSVATITTNNVAGNFSDAALAAISVGNKCVRFIGSAIIGFSQGFQPVAGYCWGAKRYGRVKECFRFTVLMGTVVSVVLGVIIGVLAKQIVGIFSSTKDEEVIRLGALMIQSQCLTMVLHMIVMLASGLFQALGRALNATIMNLSRQVIAFIPCVIVLSRLFEEEGLAVAQAVSDLVAALIAVPLIVHLMRQINRYAAQEAAVQEK